MSSDFDLTFMGESLKISLLGGAAVTSLLTTMESFMLFWEAGLLRGLERVGGELRRLSIKLEMELTSFPLLLLDFILRFY